MAKPRGGPAIVHYVGVAGVGPDAPYLPVDHRRAGVFGYDRVTRIVDIVRGTSNTMMIIETAKDNGPWTAGGPATVRGVDPATRPNIGTGRPFGGIHRGGVNVLFADASIRFVRATVDPAVFERIATIGDVEPEFGNQSY
jgi:prepilin-type processing-associated H-X9-DG protein